MIGGIYDDIAISFIKRFTTLACEALGVLLLAFLFFEEVVSVELKVKP